jgi:tetratricopeptide (TPR) repeat protein
MHEYRYRAFLCYSHRDSAWAEWLHHALETFPIPPRLVGIETGAGVIPRKLAPVFRDRDELPSAANLSAKVSDALAQSANLVVICSPHSAQSHWVDEEVRTFQRLGRGDRIFCLIVDGEPGASRWAGREHDECMPRALTHRVDDAGGETGESFEPIAADARPGGDGKATARTKLVAGLLGVDLDDLKHRERRRRRWKMTAAIAMGFALLCLTSALAVNAVIARHAAERRQKQAEDLVGFMLGDLDDKLREVNRLDILESVADKVAAYFDELPVSDMSQESLAQRAKALQKLGRLRFDQGRLDDANETLTRAEATARELNLRNSHRPATLLLLAQTLSWQGRIQWARGDLGGAERKFREGAELLDALKPAQKGDGVAADVLASIRTNIGRVLEARGDIDSARVQYESVLRIYEQLSSRDPTHLEWKSELGYAHNNLGQLAWNAGDLAAAIAEYAADCRIKSSLFSLTSESNSRREDLLISKAILGNSLLSVGEVSLARRLIESAVTDARRLVAVDADVTGWEEDAGYYEMMLASALRAEGDIVNASRAAGSARARLGDLVARDASNAEWLRELADADIEAARAFLARDMPAEARRVAATALSNALSVREKDPANQRALPTVASAQIVLGDAAIAAGDEQDAKGSWTSARELTQKFVGIGSPVWLHLHVSALLRLGHVAEASKSVDRLVAMGFRHPDFVRTLESHGVPPASTEASRLEVESAIAAVRADIENQLMN